MNAEKFKDELNHSMDNNTKNFIIDRSNDALLFIYDSLDNEKGNDNSLDIVREELSELSQAISKMIRYGKEDDWYHLLEEFADVQIALDMIAHIFHLENNEIKNAKYVKLHRLVEKIKENGYIK